VEKQDLQLEAVSIKATPELRLNLKLSIYRELHREGFITKKQLNFLIELQYKEDKT